MILRLITDFFLPKDNIVVSVTETKPFSTLIGIIITRVAIKTMEGHALYICKGKPPRPSVPLLPADLKKSPKSFGLTTGSYIAIMKESGGIKERKKALKEHAKEEKLKKEDPTAYEQQEREKSKETSRLNKLQKKIREVDSDDDLPVEIVKELYGPIFAAAGYLVITSEIGMWLEAKQLCKAVLALCGALCGGISTYYGERELDRRIRVLESETPVEPLPPYPVDTFSHDQRLKWIAGPDENGTVTTQIERFYKKLIEMYENSLVDPVDELLASFVVAPDLVDPELVVAKVAMSLGPATPFASLLCGTVASPSEDLDRLFLTTSAHKVYNTNHTAMVSDALATASQTETDDNKQNVEAAWEIIHKNIHWIFHAACSTEESTAAMWKGVSHQSTPTINHFKDCKRGSKLTWPGFGNFSETQAVAETLLKKGFDESNKNPFGGKEASKGTLLFKVTKLPVIHKIGRTRRSAKTPFLLTPFSVFEISSCRPNTNISEESFDIDLKYSSSLLTEEVVEKVRNASEKASLRLLMKTRDPVIHLVPVLCVAVGVACIAPILQEKEEERLKQLALEQLTTEKALTLMVTCSAVAASFCEATVIENASKDAAQKKAEDEARERQRQKEAEEEKLRIQTEEAAERDRKQREADERARAEEKSKALEEAKLERPTPSAPPPVAPQARKRPLRMAAVDWSQEELDAMRKFEEKMDERRQQLDAYEEKRRRQTEEWERRKLDEVNEASRKRQEGMEKVIKDQEDKYRQLCLRNEEYEEIMARHEREMARKKLQLEDEQREIEEKRKRATEEQNFTQNYLQELAKKHKESLEEIRGENEKLRDKYMVQADQIVELRNKAENAPDLEKLVEQNKKMQSMLQKATMGGTNGAQSAPFRTTDIFAPVLQWLISIGVGRYADTFADNELDMEAVGGLTEQDLDDMGITALGPRKRILEEVKTLQQKLVKTPFEMPSSPSRNRGVTTYNLKKILTEFYEKYDRMKVAQVPAIMLQFEGKYDELFATLGSIYPVFFPSPYRDRLLVLLRRSAPELISAVDILLDLHQNNEVELLGDLLRASDALPFSLSPGKTTAILPPARPSTRDTITTILQNQGTPNPAAVADVLINNFNGNEDMLLQAFGEVSQGVRPSVSM